MAGRGRGRGMNIFAPDGIPNMGMEATMARPPPLYPERTLFESEIEWTEDLKAAVHDSRRIDLLQQSSVMYIQEKAPPPKIERYTDRYSHKEVSTEVSGHISESMWSYFPEELKPSVKRQKTAKVKKEGASATALFGSALDAKDGAGGGSDEDDATKAAAEEEDENEVEEEGDDYGEDHYQSDDDAASGGDDEALY